jgi:hypothetical protein
MGLPLRGHREQRIDYHYRAIHEIGYALPPPEKLISARIGPGSLVAASRLQSWRRSFETHCFDAVSALGRRFCYSCERP